MDSTHLPIEALILDPEIQPREKIDEPTVEEYAEVLRSGGELPPVETCQDQDDRYWVWDGYHRTTAHQRAGRKAVPVRVRPGSRADAAWLALQANKAHGLKRSNADKRRAVRLALHLHPEHSDRRIASWVGVSQTFVNEMRKAQLSSDDSCESGQPGRRVGLDGRSRRSPPAVNGHATPPAAPAPATAAPSANGQHAPEAPPAAPEPAAPADPVPTDAVGIPLTGGMVEVFGRLAEFEAMMTELRRLERRAHDLAQSPGGIAYRSQLTRKVRGEEAAARFYCEHLGNARRRLEWARPHASVCPHCENSHPGRVDPRCRVCMGQGWTTRDAWERSPEDYRAAVLMARKGVATCD